MGVNGTQRPLRNGDAVHWPTDPGDVGEVCERAGGLAVKWSNAIDLLDDAGRIIAAGSGQRVRDNDGRFMGPVVLVEKADDQQAEALFC